MVPNRIRDPPLRVKPPLPEITPLNPPPPVVTVRVLAPRMIERVPAPESLMLLTETPPLAPEISNVPLTDRPLDDETVPAPKM